MAWPSPVTFSGTNAGAGAGESEPAPVEARDTAGADEACVAEPGWAGLALALATTGEALAGVGA
ncbi:MAG TPA: hypothetical protein VIF09_17785 [Polyangiaceae bacterium]